MSNRENISQRLRQFIQSRYSSQTEAAREMGMRPQTLTKYLNGTRIPGNTVKKRLQAIGCDIDWLMTGRTGSAQPGHLVSEQQKILLDELHKIGIRNRDDWRDFLSVVEEMDSTASSIRERLKKYRL